MRRRIAPIAVCTVVLTAVSTEGQRRDDAQINAYLSTRSSHVGVGSPIWVEFRIQNLTDDPVTLLVPDTEPEVARDLAGLPLEHVFSGDGFAGLTLRSETDRSWSQSSNYQTPKQAPVVLLAPHATAGISLDAREYYPALRSSGTYQLKWAPYRGYVESNLLTIQVQPLKQAEILTDVGTMTVRFFYEGAPNHVENFIELARQGFYNNLTFHRVMTGFCIQGGCPNGDGTGIRPDGKKLVAEFSDRPQTRGMVCMSRLESDADSASCQFFITNTRVSEWDGRYTIFGQLVGDASFATLDKLMNVPTDASQRPLKPLYIRGIRVSDVPNSPR